MVYGDDEYQKSFDETQALLNQYPDLKGLIAVSYTHLDVYKRQAELSG